METPDAEPGAYPPPPTDAPGGGPGRRWTIASFVLAGLAVVLFPILIGPAGVAVGAVGRRKGDPLARMAMIASVVGMLVGIVLGALLVGEDDEALRLLR